MRNTLSLFFLCLFVVCQSQIRPYYFPLDNSLNIGAAHEYPTNRIADDFGPRKLGDNWHGAIDYNVHLSHTSGVNPIYGFNGEKALIPAYDGGQ